MGGLTGRVGTLGRSRRGIRDGKGLIRQRGFRCITGVVGGPCVAPRSHGWGSHLRHAPYHSRSGSVPGLSGGGAVFGQSACGLSGAGGGGGHAHGSQAHAHASLQILSSTVMQSHKTGRVRTSDRVLHTCCISLLAVGPRAPTTTLSRNCATTHLKGTHPPLIYAQPSGLTSDWHLKYTVTMQTPTAHAHKHISGIIVSAVLNVHPFLHTWVGCLLSLTSWSQLAILSGYTRSTLLRALHSAVPRVISRTPWDVDSTLQWCCHATYILPCTRDTLFFRLHRGLQGQTVWSNQAYASWHMPHAGPCSHFCADWCHDFPILSYLTPLLDLSTSIRLGPRPRGEGSLAFPIVCELSDRLAD